MPVISMTTIELTNSEREVKGVGEEEQVRGSIISQSKPHTVAEGGASVGRDIGTEQCW